MSCFDLCGVSSFVCLSVSFDFVLLFVCSLIVFCVRVLGARDLAGMKDRVTTDLRLIVERGRPGSHTDALPCAWMEKCCLSRTLPSTQNKEKRNHRKCSRLV